MRASSTAALLALLAALGWVGCAPRRELRLDRDGRRKLTVADLERVLEQPRSVAEKVHAATRLAEEVDTTLARREAARLYVEAARESGGVPSVLAFAAATLDPEDGTCKAMLDVSTRPVAAARRVLEVIPTGLREGWIACLRALALSEGEYEPPPPRPDGSGLDAAGGLGDLAVALELEERARLRGASLEVRLHAANALLAGLAWQYPLLAARRWSLLDADVRERILEDAPRPRELGLALLAFGDRGAAEGILARLRAYQEQFRERRASQRPDAWWVVVDLTLERGVPVEPYELVSDWDVPYGDAFAVLAARAFRERVPSLAWSYLDARWGAGPDEGASACAYLPARCAAIVDAWREQDALVAEEAARTPGRPRDDRARKVTATIARLLSSPAPMPFSVRSLGPATPDRLDPPPGLGRRTAPYDRAPPRRERIDEVDYSVEVSREADPSPSAGGYWLVEREGERETRTYLGLRANAPYVVSPESRIPLVQDGTLRLEATIAERDDGRNTSIVYDGEIQRWGGPVLLEARLEDLRRDRDADGLSDLLEERLLLDPADPDTDGDGLQDGADPMPNVPVAPPAVAAGGLEALAGLEKESKLARFTVGHRGDWQGARPARRIVVLTSDEHRLAERRFGRFQVLHPTVFWADAQRGYFMWMTRGDGSCVELERQAGVWTARQVCIIDQ